MKNSTLFQRIFLPFTGIVLPIFLYILILSLQIPYTISAFFNVYSVAYFLLTGGVFYLCFQLPSKYRWIAGFAVTLVLFGLKLSFMWESGFSDGRIMGGLLPFSDGFYYYINAKLINIGSILPSNIISTKGRPLFPGLIATLLVLTQHNLRLTLAILVLIVGFSFYFSAYIFCNAFGTKAATVYTTLLFFYILEFIGYMYSETLGLSLGCLAFAAIFEATRKKELRTLIFGQIILMLGISVRPGAFFIFPLFILWSGWAFRTHEKFNFRVATIATITITVTFVFVNTIYNSLVVGPGQPTLGNFAEMLYGQVQGGAGYHSAIDDLGTRKPDIILRETARFFMKHPLSFFIGAAKAYRDFFMPDIGVFNFVSPGGRTWADIFLWAIGTLLVILGVVKGIRHFNEPTISLLAAGFLGIFFSIPFLPPIDSGTRFYASTMPFYYAIPAFALTETYPNKKHFYDRSLVKFSYLVSTTLLFFTVFMPIYIKRTSKVPEISAPSCPGKQVPFAAFVDEGSFFDVYPESNNVCQDNICLEEFKNNATSRDAADVFLVEQVIKYAQKANTPTRVWTGNDLLEGDYHLFVGPAGSLAADSDRLVTGCARNLKIKTRPSIYLIKRQIKD